MSKLLDKDLPTLALGLALYLSVGIISEELSLMSVGLFYGVLSSTSRKYLIGVVSVRSILTLMRGFYSMELIYSTIGETLRTVQGFNFERTVESMNIDLPIWAYWIILIIFLIVMIVMVIAMLPILIMQIVQYICTYVVLYIGTPIFYPGWTFWDLMNTASAADDSVVAMELFKPFVPWMFVTSLMFYIIGIPTLTFIYLRWIGFYKRIPKSWVNN